RVSALRDLHLVEELAADGDALLGGRGHLSPHPLWKAHRTHEARHACAVGLVGPALDEPRIEPVVAPALGEQIERGSILARGGPSAHTLLQRVQLLDPRSAPQLRGEHARVPERDREGDHCTRVIDGWHRAKPLEQRRGEFEDELREVTLGQAHDGPRIRVATRHRLFLRALRAALRAFFLARAAVLSCDRAGDPSDGSRTDAGRGWDCMRRIHASMPSFEFMSKPASRPPMKSDFAMPNLLVSDSAASSFFTASLPSTRKQASACSSANSRL